MKSVATDVRTSAFILAESALKLQKKVKELTDVLEKDKEMLRYYAGEETFKVTVPGLGEVMVKTPVAAAEISSTQFNLEKFNNLDAATKRKLKTLGVVTETVVKRPASKAAVVLTLNK